MFWNPFGASTAIETAAFGKLPAYADYIQWRGRQSHTLFQTAKSICYERVLPEFQQQAAAGAGINQIGIYRSSRHLILARFISSRDSVGRDQSPFLSFARGPGEPLRFWFESILAQLDRNAELMVDRHDARVAEEHWQYFSEKLNEAWDRLRAQELTGLSPSEQLECACPERLWRLPAFASGLYRMVSWLPLASQTSPTSPTTPPVLLLPILGESVSRTLYFWMSFMSQLLPEGFCYSAVADRILRRVKISAECFPRGLFDGIFRPTERGAFYHELPDFTPSASFLGMLQKVQNQLANRQFPTRRDLEL